MTRRLDQIRFCHVYGHPQAAAEIDAGQIVSCACPDSDNLCADGSTLRPEHLASRSGEFLPTPLPGNPVAGPIAVTGARVGGALAVRIHEIRLDRPTGRTLLAPGHGLIAPELLAEESAAQGVPRHMYEWEIDVPAGVARLGNPLGGTGDFIVPLRPFIGCIGVSPAGARSISTLYAGAHGGNMDLPFFAPGAVAILPIYVDGAGLAVGDVHAAQGHGEIVGGGIETSAEVTFSVHLLPTAEDKSVRAIDTTRLYAVATEDDLRRALQHANANLLRWLDHWLGVNRFDAYQLLSQCGEAILGNCVTPPYSVAAAIPINHLPGHARRVVGEFMEALH